MHPQTSACSLEWLTKSCGKTKARIAFVSLLTSYLPNKCSLWETGYGDFFFPSRGRRLTGEELSESVDETIQTRMPSSKGTRIPRCAFLKTSVHIYPQNVSVLVSKNALQICIKWAMCYCFQWILLAEPHYIPFTVVHIIANPSKFSHFRQQVRFCLSISFWEP